MGYKPLKITFIILIILFKIIGLMFLLDELIYDYRETRVIEIVIAVVIFSFLFYSIYINYKSLGLNSFQSNAENQDVLDDFQSVSSKQKLKDIRNKLLICIIVNSFVFLFMFSVLVSFTLVLSESPILLSILNPEILVAILFSLLTFLPIIMVFVDLKKRKKINLI
ncbi:hypothetical protein OAD28_05065 [Flavobacteriales bacterium]|nr:hypothetical protein [Flavobacteriales bacterium]|tara:strand:+ start:1659 stop:2156 length:498 start_codon:yes stop_codon:yes gene_type:complete